MATRLYLRDAAPTNDPGETELSDTLPGADVFQDYGIGVKSLSTTIGTGEVVIQGSSTVNTVETVEFFTSFSSEALAAQTITAETWTIAVQVSEGNAVANSLMIPVVYIFREGSGRQTPYIIDAHTALGAEWVSGAPIGRVATFTGAAITINENDYLVLEFWRHTVGQGMSMAYTQELEYDGTVDVTEDGSDSAASYLETPQNLNFISAARRIFIT